IWLQVLHRQRHSATLRIDAGDDGVYLLTFFEDLARMFDSTRPRNIRDMNQTINSLFNLDKGTEVGQISHAPVNSRADLVTLVESLPRVFLHLLHAQADPARLGVDPEDLHLDRVARVDQLARMLDPFGPTHLRDVHQTFNPRLELNESTIVSDTGNRSGDPGH